jgi:hypothetical protein
VYEKLKLDGGSVEQAPIPFMSHLPRIRIPPIKQDEFRTPVPSEYGQAKEEEREGKGKEESHWWFQQSSCAIDGRTSRNSASEENGKEGIEDTSISSACDLESKQESMLLQTKEKQSHCILRFIRCGCSEKKGGVLASSALGRQRTS